MQGGKLLDAKNRDSFIEANLLLLAANLAIVNFFN